MLRPAAALLALTLCVPAVDAAAPVQRKIFAWASPANATIAQLRNKTWAGIFDGVHAQCGVSIAAGEGSVAMAADAARLAAAEPLKAAVRAGGGEFHCWTNGVPQVGEYPAIRLPPS